MLVNSRQTADFGFTKAVRDKTTGKTLLCKSLIGTPGFIAPEAATEEEHKLSQSIDIYALGMTFYEILFSHLPPFPNRFDEDVIPLMKERDREGGGLKFLI